MCIIRIHAHNKQLILNNMDRFNSLSVPGSSVLGNYEAAISEHRQELALSEVLSDVIGRAVANRKIGECYAEMGNFTAALKVSTGNCKFTHFYVCGLKVCLVFFPAPALSP